MKIIEHLKLVYLKAVMYKNDYAVPKVSPLIMCFDKEKNGGKLDVIFYKVNNTYTCLITFEREELAVEYTRRDIKTPLGILKYVKEIEGRVLGVNNISCIKRIGE